MSKQIETEILITRDYQGVEYADIKIVVIADYAPPCNPRHNDPDDGPECSVDKSFVACEVKSESGEIIFPHGFPICLTNREEDEACEAIIQQEQAA
jgi:hypothetical protein